MTRRYNQETDDTVVRRLFQCQMSDEQIAARLDVKPKAVTSARNRMGLGMPKGRPPTVPREEEPLRPLGKDPSNPLVIAKEALQERLSEARGSLQIDGTPKNFFEVMKEANRVLAGNGKPQFGPEAWRV